MKKKAILWDLTTFVMAGIILIVLGFFLTLIINTAVDAKIKSFNEKQNRIDASIHSRQILKYEIDPGYYLYELIIESVNSNDYERIDQAMQIVFGYYSSESELDQWYYVVNDHKGYYNVNNFPTENILRFPRLEIPNSEGENILFLAKRITPTDLDYDTVVYHLKQYK